MHQTINASSIGNVACHLQINVAGIDRIARRLRLRPVLVLDNVPHFSDEQIEKIRAALERKEPKRG